MQVLVSDGAGKMEALEESSPDSEEVHKAWHMALHSNFLQPMESCILEQKAVWMQLAR